MPILSLVDCDDSAIMNRDFPAKGIYFAIGTLLFCVGLSVKLAHFATPNLYENKNIQQVGLWKSIKNNCAWLWCSKKTGYSQITNKGERANSVVTSDNGDNLPNYGALD
jgi:hypothetical protein